MPTASRNAHFLNKNTALPGGGGPAAVPLAQGGVDGAADGPPQLGVQQLVLALGWLTGGRRAAKGG